MPCSAEIGQLSCETNTGLSLRAIDAVSRMGKPSSASSRSTPGRMTHMEGLGLARSRPRPRGTAIPYKPLHQCMWSLDDDLPTLWRPCGPGVPAQSSGGVPVRLSRVSVLELWCDLRRRHSPEPTPDADS